MLGNGDRQEKRKNKRSKQIPPKTPRMLNGKMVTLNRIGRPKRGKDDQSFGEAFPLCLPAVSLPQGGDVGDVMASVPGIEREIFLQRHQSQFGMAEVRFQSSGLSDRRRRIQRVCRESSKVSETSTGVACVSASCAQRSSA